MVYKDFDIETIEEDGWHKAVIRSTSGRLLRAAVPADSLPGPAITTNSYPTAKVAIHQAKRRVDAGGIVLVLNPVECQ